MAKRGRKKGTIPQSKFEEFRDIDGTIDRHLVAHTLLGEKRYADIENEFKRESAFREGRPQKMLQCPFCGFLTPKTVAVNASGKPKRPPQTFIKYVKNDGKIERRYAGIPFNKMNPITVQYRHPKYGWHINDKECIPPSLLKKIDADLYNDFKQILANTLKQFP